MRRTLAVLNQKGGVGKTTVTLGLASAAAQADRRVLVVDLDPQASSSWVLGIDPDQVERSLSQVLSGRSPAARAAIMTSEWSDRIDVLPATADLQRLERGAPSKLRDALADLEDDYEAILIDCPPSLGNLSRSALTAARHAVIVVEPSALGLRGIGGVADMVDEVWDETNADLELAGVILNRVPAVSNESDRRVDELARIVGKRAIWKPSVPQRVIFNEAIGARRSIHSYGSRAADPIATFDALWRKVRNVVKAADVGA